MIDVLIAGAGPAGAVAAVVLARAGARVLMLDRARFPREKLCGDTLNPGALDALGRLGLTGGPIEQAPLLAGMILSDGRRAIAGRYPDGIAGRAITRRALDAWLLDRAVECGVKVEQGVIVRGVIRDDVDGRIRVRGLTVDSHLGGPSLRVPAQLTIAADGRRSVLARGLGLSSHPRRWRRWAFGVYASNIAGLGDLGEMHIRRDHYLGIAPIGNALSNVCLVTSPRPGGPRPLDLIRSRIDQDDELRARFTQARFESPVTVLGPLAVDVRAAGVEGLLLAGDAAGFVDPMTGDGLRLAIEGAELAAAEALRVLERGDPAGAPARLLLARRARFGTKLRFNRSMRALVDSPAGMSVAGLAAGLVPATVERLVRYAGDAAR